MKGTSIGGAMSANGRPLIPHPLFDMDVFLGLIALETKLGKDVSYRCGKNIKKPLKH